MAKRVYATFVVSGYVSSDEFPAQSNGTCAYLSLADDNDEITYIDETKKILSKTQASMMGDVWLTEPKVTVVAFKEFTPRKD